MLPLGVSSPATSALVEEPFQAIVALRELIAANLVLASDWEALPASAKEELEACSDRDALCQGLVTHALLTEYQAGRIAAGTTFGLLLGNYRVVERLASGGMGIIFKGEHVRLRRPVAIKVLPLSNSQDTRLLARFSAEMEAVARLQHPNIVRAIDAGEVASPDPDAPVLHYHVMEYLPGQDLEEYVRDHGTLTLAAVCRIGDQIASALAEAHKHGLVHRDIKPPNILLTPDGQAKLLDFGLARQPDNRMTEPGTCLGTMDFVAPEQARDAATVDIRADIYGLGGTLFWCLTGQKPFPSRGNLALDIAAHLTSPPPSLRDVRRDVPIEFDRLIRRMMALDPADRLSTPEEVIEALAPFWQRPADMAAAGPSAAPRYNRAAGKRRILIVDDDPGVRRLCRAALQADTVECDEASDGLQALDKLRVGRYDVALLDVNLPGMKGTDVCRWLRDTLPAPQPKVVLFSGHVAGDDMAPWLSTGADDYLSKPISVVELQARVHAALRLKEAQDAAGTEQHELRRAVRQLEDDLESRAGDLQQARGAIVTALTRLIEQRPGEDARHMLRIQRYCRCLAEAAATEPAFVGRITPEFICALEECAPLHDVGKIALPDHIAMKPGRLDEDERHLMQSHAALGADMLEEIVNRHGPALAFLRTAITIARHHHERWDGSGYPDRLAGEFIPLEARLITLADVYDALRSRRSYKPKLVHLASLEVMNSAFHTHFDPGLQPAFERCAPQLDQIYTELGD
jgi:response regulator RpfG family c-di-GMP phosphodiesterase